MENKLTPKQANTNLYQMVSSAGNGKDFDLVVAWKYHEIIEQALTELEETKKINEIFKNAITIKYTGIHCEEKLDHSIDTFIYAIQPICEVIQNNIEEELKRQLREWVLKNAFPQELKALEIIKNKNFDLFYLQDSKDLEMYNDTCDHFRNLCYLTQEEYDLLKEWLQ